jgi:hypothetical protein
MITVVPTARMTNSRLWFDRQTACGFLSFMMLENEIGKGNDKLGGWSMRTGFGVGMRELLLRYSSLSREREVVTVRKNKDANRQTDRRMARDSNLRLST